MLTGMTEKPERSLLSKNEGRHSGGKPSDQYELSLMTKVGGWKALGLCVKTTDGTTVDRGLLTIPQMLA